MTIFGVGLGVGLGVAVTAGTVGLAVAAPVGAGVGVGAGPLKMPHPATRIAGAIAPSSRMSVAFLRPDTRGRRARTALPGHRGWSVRFRIFSYIVGVFGIVRTPRQHAGDRCWPGFIRAAGEGVRRPSGLMRRDRDQPEHLK
jgi:hypothetical protein